MNINLTKAAGNKPKKKKSLSFGLNARGNVFGESSSSDDETRPAGAITGREAVNRAIVQEQAALRERAAAASADIANSEIYNYDGAYDSFHKKDARQSSKSDKGGDDPKKSRYIGDLLKAAEQRQRERDVAYERKVAREQAAEEEAEPEFRGKERFVTAGYKRKLEERKIWQEQDEKQRKLEEENDVTKQTDGVASFYGNLNKNVAMGGGETKKDDEESGMSTGVGFLDGFAKADDSDRNQDKDRKQENLPDAGKDAKTEDPVARRKRMRLLREKKVEEARERYFQRKAASASTTQ